MARVSARSTQNHGECSHVALLLLLHIDNHSQEVDLSSQFTTDSDLNRRSHLHDASEAGRRIMAHEDQVRGLLRMCADACCIDLDCGRSIPGISYRLFAN